jgi:hypothetical protein
MAGTENVSCWKSCRYALIHVIFFGAHNEALSAAWHFLHIDCALRGGQDVTIIAGQRSSGAAHTDGHLRRIEKSRTRRVSSVRDLLTIFPCDRMIRLSWDERSLAGVMELVATRI